MANNRIDMTVGLKVDKSGLNQLKKSLQQMQKLNWNDLMKINGGSLDQAKQAYRDIHKQAEKVETALKAAFNPKLNTVNIEKFKNQLAASGTSLNSLYSTFHKAGSAGENAFRNLSSQLLRVNTAAKETSSLFNKMATTFANTIKWNISSSVFNSLTGSVQQAWNFTKALDSSLNDIRIVTGKSADEMDKFAEKANAAAQELGATTKDYTNASLIFAQQGLNDKEIEAKTNVTLKVANVTRQDAAAVSEQLTAVWNGYKVGAEEAELYADRLAAVASKSASNLQELATGMSKVASAAATMGVSEEQLAAQLSTIISVTRQAPESVGVALKTVYARMSDIKAGLDEDGVSLGNYSGKMAAFGINVLDMSGNLRDMGEVIEEIGGKWGTMTRQQQVSLAQTMGGQRQYSNLVALFDNFDKYQNMVSVAQSAEGTLEKQNETYMDRLTTHITKMTAATEKLFMTLVDSDGFKTLIDIFTKLIELVSTFTDAVGGLGPILSVAAGQATKLFSKDIVQNIQRTFLNKSNKEQVDQENNSRLKEIRKIQKDNPQMDSKTQELYDLQAQLLQDSSRLSNAENEEIQGLIDKLLEATNAEAAFQTSFAKQREQIKATFETYRTYLDGFVDFQKLATNPDEYIAFSQKMEALQNVYQETQQGIAKISMEIEKVANSTNKSESALDGFLASTKKQTERMQHILDNLGEQQSKIPSQLNTKIRKAQEALRDFKPLAVMDDFSTVPNVEGLKELQTVFEELAKNVESSDESLTKILDDFREKFPELEQQVRSVRQLTEDAEIAKQQAEEKLVSKEQTFKMQDLTQMVGGLTQVYGAMQSIANLGNIWAQSESFGEGFLKTIIAMGASLPSLMNGISSVQKGLKALDAASLGAAIKAKILGVAVKDVKGVSLSTALTAKVLGVDIQEVGDKSLLSSGKMAIFKGGVTLLKTSFQELLAALGPVGIALIALGSAMAIYNFYKQELQETIQTLEKEIETEKKQQQQLKNEKSLLKEVAAANKEYEEGSITRIELKSKIQDLTEQYEAEDQIVKTLTADYGHLNNAIAGIEQQVVEEQGKSIQREFQKEKDLFQRKLEEYGAFFGEVSNITLDPGWTQADEGKAVKILNDLELGFPTVPGSGTFKVSLGETVEDQISTIKKLQQAYQTMGKQMSDSERASSQYYKFLGKLLSDITPIIEQLEKTEEAGLFNSVSQLAIKNKSKYNFDNIDNAIDYRQKRLQLINDIISSDITNDTEKANNLADNYLKDSFKEQFFQFEEAGKAIDLYSEKFKENKEEIGELISKLDENQVSALLEIDSTTITSWEQLKKIAQDFAQIDFSNVKDPFTGYSTENLKAASAQYNKYNTLFEQVKDGKSISTKEKDGLDASLKEMFQQNANGTWQMTKDFKTFEKQVNNLQFSGFKDTLEGINAELDALERVKNLGDNFEYNDIDKAATTDLSPEEKKTLSDDEQQTLTEQRKAEADVTIQQQLEYLEAVAAPNSALAEQIELWKAMSPQQLRSKENAEAIYEAIGKIGNKTANTEERTEQLEKLYDETAKKMAKAMFPTDSDVDTKALSSLTDVLQGAAKDSKDLADGLSEDRDAAEDVAESILRFDDAIKDVTKDYKTWKTALDSKSYQDLAKVLPELRDAYADLLDLDGSSLSEDFLSNADNLELMKKAINGNTDAYNQLLDLAQQDILAHIQMDPAQIAEFQNQLNNVKGLLDDKNFPDLEVGASLNDESFLQSLTNMVNAAGMTAQQATDFLSTMGVDAEVVEDKRTEKVKSQYTDAIAKVTTQEVESINPSTGNPITYKIPTIQYETIPSTSEGVQENAAFSLKVTSAKKSSGGGFKFKQSTHGAGSGKSSRKSSGGKKGGGGSGNKADKSQKDTKKTDKKQQDIYHDINIELKDINRALERTQKTQEKLYGKELLDNLQKQSDLLDEHIKKLREKEALQKADLKNKQAELKTLGLTFDKYGHITNYLEKLTSHQNKINKLTEEYNALVKKYNASTNKATKEKINEQIISKDKQIKQAEDAKKQTEEKIKNYEELQDDREELLDQIEEELDKQTEIAIKKFRLQLEIRLETGDAERDWNDFKRNVLNADDVLKTNSFSTIMKDAQKSLEDFGSYFDVAGAKGSITILTEQVKATKQQIEDIDKLGESAIYGKNKAQAMEDLKTDLSDLMSKLGEVQELIKALDQAYLDGMADIKEQYNNRQEQLGFIGELVQHDMDLLGIIFGSKNYAAMQKYYETLRQNQNSQINLLREESNYWKDKWEQALRNGNTNAAKQFENNYKDSINNLNSLLDTAAQTLKDKYLNAIDAIFDQVNNKLTSGKGLDYLDLEWDLINKNAESYLDKINSAYAIQDFQNKSTKAINDAKGLKNQQALKKVAEEQLKILRNKDKLTQYDVDRADKMLELEKARLALEEARQNKTSLRLKRDSQGNYSYQYVSDNNKILEAQEALAKAQNELFNFDAQKYKDNLKEVSEAWKEYQGKVHSILQDEALSEEERSYQLQLVKTEYETYITNKLKENLFIRENLMQSAFDEYSALYDLDAQKFANMSAAEKDVIMNELVPQWDSGIANMINRLNGDGEQQGLAQAWEDTFEQIKNKEQEFKQEQAELFKEAGIDPEDLQNAFNPIVDVYSDLIETNKEFLNQLDEEKSALENIASQAEKLKDQYKGIFEYAKKSAEEAQKFRTEQEKAAAAAAQTADKTKSKTNAQADTKAAQQKAQQTIAKGSSTSVSKASVNNGGNSSSSSKKGTGSGSGGGSNAGGGSVPKKPTEDANFKKIQQLQKKIANYESSLNAAKGHVPAATLSSSFLKPAEKLQKELNSIIKKVQKGNLKDAQKLQTKANTSIKNIQQYINKVMNPSSVANKRTTGIATSQYGLLQPTNTLEKHTIGKDSLGQWVSGESSFFKKINTFYIENYLGSIWKNYKTRRKYTQYYDNKNKRHFIDVGSFDTGGYTGDWADQQGRLALLHKKELVLNAKDTKNMLDMVTISKKTLNGLRSKSSLSLSKLSKTLDFNAGAVEQNVHITASFPNVNSKREIEQAFNDLINLAAQRALKRF